MSRLPKRGSRSSFGFFPNDCLRALLISIFILFLVACGDTNEPRLDGELPSSPRSDVGWSSISGEFADARIDVGLCPSSEMVIENSGAFRVETCRRGIRGSLNEAELARLDDLIARALANGASGEVTCVGPPNSTKSWNYVVDLPDGMRKRIYFSDSIRGSCASISFEIASELDQVFADLMESKAGTPRGSRPFPGPPQQPAVGISRPAPPPVTVPAPIPVPGPVFEPLPNGLGE